MRYKSLVTHGASECWGYYDSTTQTGWGDGFASNCIHSSIDDHSSSNTAWYNYTLASANTVIDKSTSSINPAANMNTATESVCPKGWNLPGAKQTDANKTISSFSPILGGVYFNGVLYDESTRGIWWASESFNGARRYDLNYYGNTLYIGYGNRYNGYYIRCVSEEKTVTDLTYMQDMTPEIAPVLSLCI